MPRPRKSAATLKLSGAFEKNRSRERSDVTAHGDVGIWRAGSADPADIWGELVRNAPAGLLTSADRPALEAATLLLARVRSQPASVTPATVTALFAALGKLGMTPAGRVQLGASKTDPLEMAKQLWKRGERKRAIEINPFYEFAEPPSPANDTE